jgi:hypothetical protein
MRINFKLSTAYRTTRKLKGWITPNFGHPPSPRGPPQHPASCQTQANADENPKTYLLEGKAYPVTGWLKLHFGCCQGQKERQEGHRKAIVEPGLYVEGLAHVQGDARVVHNRLDQRRIGRSEDGTHDGCLPEGEIGQHQRRLCRVAGGS